MATVTITDHEVKLDNLRKILKGMGSLLIAYSGGVDSTFLLKVAYDELGQSVLAVTAKSETYMESEFKEAREFISDIGARHLVIDSEELDVEGFRENPPDRCYFCKKELFSKLREVADREGIKYIADGTNYDDLNDHRPGMKAASELRVRSPLKEAWLTKDEIRLLSKQMGLPTWDKPAMACLSSRFPYGTSITREKLTKVARAEMFLKGIGFKQFRVRHHDTIARIEVSQDHLKDFLDDNIRDRVLSEFKEIGYHYVTLDLEGYRTGSMNEVLTQ